jgi:hypothetical protein
MSVFIFLRSVRLPANSDCTRGKLSTGGTYTTKSYYYNESYVGCEGSIDGGLAFALLTTTTKKKEKEGPAVL